MLLLDTPDAHPNNTNVPFALRVNISDLRAGDNTLACIAYGSENFPIFELPEEQPGPQQQAKQSFHN